MAGGLLPSMRANLVARLRSLLAHFGDRRPGPVNAGPAAGSGCVLSWVMYAVISGLWPCLALATRVHAQDANWSVGASTLFGRSFPPTIGGDPCGLGRPVGLGLRPAWIVTAWFRLEGEIAGVAHASFTGCDTGPLGPGATFRVESIEAPFWALSIRSTLHVPAGGGAVRLFGGPGRFLGPAESLVVGGVGYLNSRLDGMSFLVDIERWWFKAPYSTFRYEDRDTRVLLETGAPAVTLTTLRMTVQLTFD